MQLIYFPHHNHNFFCGKRNVAVVFFLDVSYTVNVHYSLLLSIECSNFKCLTWPANVLSCNMLENHEKSICAMQETSLDIQDIRILVLVATRLGLL